MRSIAAVPHNLQYSTTPLPPLVFAIRNFRSVNSSGRGFRLQGGENTVSPNDGTVSAPLVSGARGNRPSSLAWLRRLAVAEWNPLRYRGWSHPLRSRRSGEAGDLP